MTARINNGWRARATICDTILLGHSSSAPAAVAIASPLFRISAVARYFATSSGEIGLPDPPYQTRSRVKISAGNTIVCVKTGLRSPEPHTLLGQTPKLENASPKLDSPGPPRYPSRRAHSLRFVDDEWSAQLTIVESIGRLKGLEPPLDEGGAPPFGDQRFDHRLEAPADRRAEQFPPLL